MGRTATNVAGQALVPTLVAAREGILDRAAYDAPRRGRPWAEREVVVTATAPQESGRPTTSADEAASSRR